MGKGGEKRVLVYITAPLQGYQFSKKKKES